MVKKTTNPSVYIVTPVFNSEEHTRNFLESVKRQDYKNLKVVIVDDGSDGTSDMITKEFPETILLRAPFNSLWWSRGTNKGVEYALKQGAEYILTVNNDVEVKKDWVSELVKCALKNPKSLIGTTIYYKKDKSKIWYFGADFNNQTGDLYHIEVKPKPGEVRESKWLTGMGVLVPVEVYKKIGMYDAKTFPQYFADADFSLRAAKAGYKLLVTSNAILYNDTDNDRGSKIMRQNTYRAILPIIFEDKSIDSIKIRRRFYKRHFGEYYKRAYKAYLKGRVRGLYYPYIKNVTKIKLKRLRGQK
jgi:GT2 family glycosyltransferase